MTDVAVPSPFEGGAERAPDPQWVLAALLAGAGLVHLVMVPAHLGESTADGVGFLAAGAAQLAVAVLAVTRPRRWVWVAAALTSVVCVAAWAVSRTVGLPYGAHSGVAEEVAFVDLVTVALEVAAVAASLALLVGVERPAASRARRPAVSVVGAVAALLLAGAALVSPSAREHGGAGHGHGEEAAGHTHGEDGHAHGAGSGNDLGYADLVNGQMGSHHHDVGPGPKISSRERGELAQQLALTAPLIAAYPTVADAKAAGYRQAGPFSPGLGTHYQKFGGGMTTNQDGDMDSEDIASGMLIYDGVEDDSPLAGFMYMAYQEDAPEGFAGDLDRWHFHTAVCMVITADGIDTPYGADLTGVTEKMCQAKGGNLVDFTGYMVHVWTVPGYESSEGVFSDLNPKITCPDGTYYRIPISKIGDADSTCRNP